MKRTGSPVVFDCECGDHSWAPLTRGYITLVSPCHRHLLLDGFWCALVRPNGSAHVVRTQKRRRSRWVSKGHTIWLHKEIADLGEALIDHKNGNSIDNRVENLRGANKSLNAANTRKAKGSSGYRGVQVCRHKHSVNYAAKINDGKCRRIGTFATAIEAARAYDAAALKAFGEFAHLNFPSDADCRAAAEAAAAARDAVQPVGNLDLFGEAA